jgi:hypothetical protein
MFGRVGSPNAASRRERGEDEGRAAASILGRGKANGPAIGSTNLGTGLTVRRPELRSRQSRFESGLPKNPNKRDKGRRQAALPLQSPLPGSRPEAMTAIR